MRSKVNTERDFIGSDAYKKKLQPSTPFRLICIIIMVLCMRTIINTHDDDDSNI